MLLDNVIERIEEKFSKNHLPEIRKFLRQPSVSATGEGIRETTGILVKKIKNLGGEDVHLAQTMGEEFGHPQVYGEVWSDKSKPTILFYSMYDVQPVYPEKWVLNDKKIDPFGAEIHEFEWFPGISGQVLMNRGVTNQKGPTMAAFNVFETFLEETGELPINIIFAIEGEEELGSPHMKTFIDEYAEKLKQSTAVYFPMFFEMYDGSIKFFLGVRGVIETKIWCRGGTWGGPVGRNLHSSNSGLVENPIFKLIEVLSSLKNDKTNEILVPGVMDDPDIVGPSEEDEKVIEVLLQHLNFEDVKKNMSVTRFRDFNGQELTGKQAIVEQLFKPGLSINGIEGGYYGKGGMTIIPYEVHANLDIRLPPFQKVEYVKECYRTYIKKHFPMVELDLGAGYGPAKMSPSHPLIQVTKSIYEESGKQPVFYPLLAGSAPFSMFQSILQLPFVYGGLAHGGRAHSPLEYAVIESKDLRIGGIIEFEKFFAKFLIKVAQKL
ncbi:MAG: M20/M25/M40 family metallo-hydrolase [Candidatus Heimdallarchaeota archaeon]|nr:MAG: M20/M25/M40 family metallo-hydrolase [Candidatus Heimdallarchaeota archaeon]